MKTITLLAGAALAATLSAAPAYAQASKFAGPKVEVHVGWDQLSGDGDASYLPARNEDGILYGVGLGYDGAIGDRIIVGVEAAFDLSDIKYEKVAGNTRTVAEAERDLEVSARIGTTVTDNVLVYVKGGYANTKIEGGLIAGGTAGTTRTPFSQKSDGYRVGGGIEVAFTQSLYGKAEYRYSDYEGGLSRNQVLAGFGFRF